MPLAAVGNAPLCLVTCFVCVLRSPGHVATRAPCASCNFIRALDLVNYASAAVLAEGEGMLVILTNDHSAV